MAGYLNTTYYPVDVEIRVEEELHVYELTLTQPTEGYITFYISGEIETEAGNIFMTTQANIAPNSYHYDRCSGPAECLGCLI